ncbi:MAG: PAS domain S-box protein, partial [Desulfovibrionales bacterium]
LQVLRDRFANMQKAVRRREDSLRKSEENLRITLHSIGDAVIATDIEGAVARMNKVAQELTGWSEDEALGCSLCEVFNIINSFSRKPCANPMQKVLDTGEIQGLANHTVLISRDGREYQIADSASPIRDSEGNIAGVVLVFRDVTDKYLQEEQLKTERRRLADAIEGTRAGTWEWNVKTGEVAVNERWAEIIGYRLEEVAPMTFATWEYYTHSEDLERSDELLKKHLNGEVDYYECEVRMLHKKGGWVWVLDRGKVTQRDEDGSPLLVSGTHQDVTEKKKVEENMRLMAEVLENSDNIAVFKDPELKYINVNKAYLQLTGYESPKDVIGKIDAKLFAGLASEAQIREYMDNDLGALGLDPGEVLTVEEYFPDENLDRTFLTKKFPVYSDSGSRLLGVATLATEITEQKNMQREILTAKEKAEAANLAKSQFLANMSHEIRTPLNGIMGMIQLMQSTSLNHEQDEYVRLAYKSTKRLNRLLTDILDLSRVEAGKEEIREEEFSLTEVLRSIKEIFIHSAKDSSNTIEVNSYGEIPERLHGDGTRLTQILFNLAGNACKYTRNGQVAVNVSALPETISGQSRLLFVVEDNGPGIPDDNIDDIFEVFTQAGKQDNPYARKYEGAGLGLPLVRRLVRLMGGTLSIDSREGEGTGVYVSLPFGVLDSEQSGESEETVFEAENQAVRESNILVVDDDKVTRMYMQRLLEKLGFGADVAEDGDQALSKLADGEYDCLLMDVQMPVMDGVEATRRIRTGETGPADIPIIALTAYAMSGDREKFMDAGMDDYLSKPVDKNELLQMLNRFLD